MKNKRHAHTANFWYAIIIGLAIILTGCNGTEVGNPDSGGYSTGGDMYSFSDDAELETYLVDQYTKSVTAPVYYEETDAVADGGSEAPSSGGSNTYTGTNVQETGVDESDMLKTDGHYFYIARQDTVVVVAAADPMQIAGSMTVGGYVSSLYLYDHTLVVLYTPSDGGGVYWGEIGMVADDFTGFPGWIPMRAANGVALFDISNPALPVLIRKVEVDGRLVSSRRVDNRLFVIQQFLPNIPYPCSTGCFQDMQLNELIPHFKEFDRSGEPLPEQRLVGFRHFYRPGLDGGGSIVSVLTFDLDDPQAEFERLGVVADAEIVYASTQSLYLAATQWDWEAPVENEWGQQTLILKYDLTGDDVEGRGFRTVKGRILNQFSLGEHEGTLRIATTTGSTWGWGPSSKNHVFCLQSKDDKLEIVGKLENIAPGEQLYSARFIGERGFLVTFLNIDPLFTLDLSDPTSPAMVGELKVPGYSTYLHPWGEDLLIAIGKDAKVEYGQAFYQGVQLSVFDISDFADPQLLHSEIIGTRGTDSEALNNHKAFTFWDENGLLAIPIDLHEHNTSPAEPWSRGSHIFSGLYVYRVDTAAGFDLLGRIRTAEDAYTHAWTRGVFIEDTVYAVTSEAVFSGETENIEETIESIALGTE